MQPARRRLGHRRDDDLVITVQSFGDEDEAVRWADGVPYGFASSVWTRDHGRAMRVSRRLDFGCVWINCHIPLVAEMPHGGFKRRLARNAPRATVALPPVSGQLGQLAQDLRVADATSVLIDVLEPAPAPAAHDPLRTVSPDQR